MSERDWSEPPLGDAPESLWTALHDGGVRHIESDRLVCSLKLRVELGFPAPPEGCPEEVEIVFSNVTHALLFTYWNWPGPFPSGLPVGSPEASAAYDAYQRKSRTETSEIALLNRWVEEETQVEILQAELHKTSTSLTLVLDGTTNDFESASGWQLRIAAASLDVRLQDGSPFGLAELMRLGEAGWDAWSAKSEARRSAASILPTSQDDQQPREQQP